MDIQKNKFVKPKKNSNMLAYIIILLILIVWKIITISSNGQAQSKILPATHADKMYDIQTNK